MPNYKLTIQYEGTRYKGWQEQKHTEATIQGKLQRVLERMTEEEIDLQGLRQDRCRSACERSDRTFSYKGSVGCGADQKIYERISAGRYCDITGRAGRRAFSFQIKCQVKDL